MKEDQETQPRALPAAVFVPEHTMKTVVKRVAKLSEEKRENEIIILFRTGRYRASTDQVILYQHESYLPPPKADLMEVIICKVSEVSTGRRVQIDAPKDNDKFLAFMRKYWDESLELDSPVTMLICSNLRGELLDRYVEINQFHNTLPKFSQE